jgi:hypothetical protein
MTTLADRSCAGCSLCCSLLSVAELEKPPLVPCGNCLVGSGCRIYPQRPTECRQFYCGYLLRADLDSRWKPSRSGLVVAFDEPPYAVAIHVDPATPDAWHIEPYFTQIHRWARAAAGRNAQVVVWQGDRKIVVSPDHHALPASTPAPAEP